MAAYIGIDLGTTNSAICSYDGENLHLYKSPEQHSVTPSAIYIDKRSKYYGARAYRMAAYAPENTAILFKRLMGTSTPIKLPAVGITMTPEECSAEVLRVLFSYLPEDIRNSPETGTVITVPAAFNQMQKDATMAAAQMAGIGRVALMQEPVAAVMSVMRQRKKDGMFLIYDMGGGTFDVALAESISGRVTLVAHGGVEMCGGRDFDRAIVDNIIKEWLIKNFDLPDDFSVNPRYRQLKLLAAWAAEQTKIELSFNKTGNSIYMPDVEIRTRDESGNDIYIDVELSRHMLDNLLSEKIRESIQATREVLEKANLSPHDIERIVFVGGPTQYKPLRDKVSFELGIPGSTDVDPMTAVAEGAALFAESIDWSTASRSRKSNRGTISTPSSLGIQFLYQSRTPDIYSKVIVKITGKIGIGASWQIDSLDSGWSSGRMELIDGRGLNLPLSKNGENRFKVFIFDEQGGPIKINQDVITIVRTTATIDAIPASHTISVAIKDRIGGREMLDPLIKAGDTLPKQGEKRWRAEHTLRAGGDGQIVITLWEGDIEHPISDNRRVGCFKITGKDFDEGTIKPSDEIICEYEISDSGTINMTVTVPSIQGTFSPGHNFYSRQEGQIDYTNAIKQIEDEASRLQSRVHQLYGKIDDERLGEVHALIEEILSKIEENPDPESCKQAMDNILAAKKLMSKISKDNKKQMRMATLEGMEAFFEANIREYSKPAEVNSFETLLKTARRCIESGSHDFDVAMDGMKDINTRVLWRQEWFVVSKFKQFAEEEYMFSDKVAS